MSEYIEREAFLESQRHLYCGNCARRKNGKGKFVYEIGDAPCRACDIGDVLDAVEDFPAADVRPVPYGGIGEMSDGYHIIAQKPTLKRRIVYRGAVYNALEAERINHLDGILSDRYKEGFHDGLKKALEILGGLPDAKEGE